MGWRGEAAGSRKCRICSIGSLQPERALRFRHPDARTTRRMSDLQRSFVSAETIAAFPTSGGAPIRKPAGCNSFQPPISANPPFATVFGPKTSLKLRKTAGLREPTPEKVRKTAGLREPTPEKVRQAYVLLSDSPTSSQTTCRGRATSAGAERSGGAPIRKPAGCSSFRGPFQQTRQLQQFLSLASNKPAGCNSFRGPVSTNPPVATVFGPKTSLKLRKTAGLRGFAPKKCGKQRVCGNRHLKKCGKRMFY